mmetsp:Transcript_2500/g.6274  ORF Transcript_2500/g.6274 Transcript_2500/m.6274 type:complete len:203 (+) Transcript_2500:2133-2741(+)
MKIARMPFLACQLMQLTLKSRKPTGWSQCSAILTKVVIKRTSKNYMMRTRRSWSSVVPLTTCIVEGEEKTSVQTTPLWARTERKSQRSRTPQMARTPRRDQRARTRRTKVLLRRAEDFSTTSSRKRVKLVRRMRVALTVPTTCFWRKPPRQLKRHPGMRRQLRSSRIRLQRPLKQPGEEGNKVVERSSQSPLPILPSCSHLQ